MKNVISVQKTAENIRSRLSGSGITLHELSRALAVPEEKAALWLEGRELPDAGQLYTIAHGLLNCTIEDVLSINPKKVWVKG